MEHDVGEDVRRDILQHNHLDDLSCTGKNVERGHSAQESVWNEVGRVGEESSILHFPWYILGMLRVLQ